MLLKQKVDEQKTPKNERQLQNEISLMRSDLRPFGVGEQNLKYWLSQGIKWVGRHFLISLKGLSWLKPVRPKIQSKKSWAGENRKIEKVA